MKSAFLLARKRFVYALNTHLLTNSEGTRKDVIERFNVRASKVFVQSFLIPSSDTLIKRKENRSMQLAIVGRLAKSKGHSALLKQFKFLLGKYREAILKIVGKGNEKDDLYKEVKHLNILKSVHFTGSIPNKSISQIYANSLAHISSSYEEAFGMVNIEALREAFPIICTKTAGSIDILSQSVNGEYFDLDREGSLLEAFDRIYTHWSQYSEGALDSFNLKYSLDNISTHVESLLNRIHIKS